VTTDGVNKPKTGTHNGIQYWEEKGATNPWGYVSPGYGGYAYDIQGVYFTYDIENFYFAAIVGMPREGYNGGLWNGVQWATSANGPNEFMGDIALDINNDKVYDYGIETGGTPAGRYGAGDLEDGALYSVNAWTAGIDFPQSSPVNIKTGTLVDEGALAYDKLIDTSLYSLYYIESMVPRIYGFSGTLNIHLTQTCGNDAADLTVHVAPVPEPATVFLFGSGLIGLASLVRRKKIVRR